MVAYQSERYKDMLPTVSDKIEHFLSAYLGLVDPHKWLKKVDNKLKKIKAVIQGVDTGHSTKSVNVKAVVASSKSHR